MESYWIAKHKTRINSWKPTEINKNMGNHGHSRNIAEVQGNGMDNSEKLGEIDESEWTTTENQKKANRKTLNNRKPMKNEAEQKGWCDKELSTNKQTREKKTEDVLTLTAEIDELLGGFP